MGTLDINELVDLSLNLIFYFTIGSFGAFIKVLYESMTRKNYKIRLGKIIIGGGTTAILCAGLNYNLLHQYNIGTRFMIASIVGVLGFEIFGKIKNIEGLKGFLQDLVEISSAVRDIATGRNDNNKINEESTEKKLDDAEQKKDDDVV